MKIPVFLLAFVLLLGCESHTHEHPIDINDSTVRQVKDTSVINEQSSVIDNDIHSTDTFYVDDNLKDYLEHIGMAQTYTVSTRHSLYFITGYFNGDDVIDTAIIVNHKKNHKDGLLIKHGGGDEYIVLGAGEEVLSRGFDDMNWVGQFYKISKGEQIASNIDEETGEIRTDEVPDSEKFTLLTEGIFIHEEEACGGGIIYWNNGKYNWIQQE